VSAKHLEISSAFPSTATLLIASALRMRAVLLGSPPPETQDVRQSPASLGVEE